MATMILKVLLFCCFWGAPTLALVPFIDGGKGIPKLYDGWMNGQIAKQARTAVSKAIASGKTKIEVNFPPVPNVEEARFGTPLNQQFGTSVVARQLGVPGGYRPGSSVSRQLIGFSNVYWAKELAPSVGGMGKRVSVLSAEQVAYKEIKNTGVDFLGGLGSGGQRDGASVQDGDAIIAVNPGGEETWDRIYSTYGSPSAPMVVLNNAYSTTYGLGNKRGYEEAYFLKRISKGWIFRQYPGNWEAYLEKPDFGMELMASYKKSRN
eukprot:CAMPEP_0172442206 /NCGR_PEP_ID=MMETSP1065-20121228/2672_1 /TAXON_ID=265537 /ORGANISM="Amphiprora paludosa, Strain CCMP125" /LENGTH=263 /DNA_ID=CAMNT_0013191973 /DNA_START=10 /DNA_END=801 /DNA_ORIENTATION=+